MMVIGVLGVKDEMILCNEQGAVIADFSFVVSILCAMVSK